MLTKFFHYLTITLLLFSVILRPDPGFAVKTFQDKYERKKQVLLQFAQSLGQENPQDIAPTPGTSRFRVLVNVTKAKVTLLTKNGNFTGTSNFALPYDQPNFPSGPAKLRLEVKGFNLIEHDIVVPDRSKVTEIFTFDSLEKTVKVIEDIEKLSILEDPKSPEVNIETTKEVETTKAGKEEKIQPEIIASTPPTEHQINEGSSYLNITISRWEATLGSVVGFLETTLAAYEAYTILIDGQKIGKFENVSGATFNHKEPLSSGKHDIEIIYNNYALGILPVDERIYKNTIVIEDNGSDLKLIVLKDFKCSPSYECEEFEENFPE